MDCVQNKRKTTKKMSANEKYLHQFFYLLQKRENAAVARKKDAFFDSELGLLGTILSAKERGERLISTRLADMLGITRSAISQIVNRLEARGVVKRVADDVDKKIAYIEASEDIENRYQQAMKAYTAFTGKVIKKYGAEKFQTLCEMADEFFALFEEEKKNFEGKKSK